MEHLFGINKVNYTICPGLFQLIDKVTISVQNVRLHACTLSVTFFTRWWLHQ